MSHILVVGTMLIRIPYHESYGATSGATFKDSAEDFHTVFLLACRSETALSGTTACQFALDKVHVHGNAGRHAVNHSSYGLAMALAKGGKSEYVAKCIHLSNGNVKTENDRADER